MEDGSLQPTVSKWTRIRKKTKIEENSIFVQDLKNFSSETREKNQIKIEENSIFFRDIKDFSFEASASARGPF